MKSPPGARLLVLEDDPSLIHTLFSYLETRGYQLDASRDGEAGVVLAQRGRYDALIVDWALPSRKGIDVVRELRDRDYAVPILMLGGCGDVEEKVTAFRAGADDYLSKPFALPELEVRIEALLARRRGRSRRLIVTDLNFDLDTQQVTRGAREIPLSSSARRLLEALMRAAPSVVPRMELEHILWGDDPPQGDMLRSHMYELRRAIDGEAETKLLHTLRGVGYRLSQNDSPEAASSS